MRTFELLRIFTDREIEEIDSIVEARARKSLKALYTAVKKSKNRKSVPGIDVLFHAVFNKRYSTEKDNLIRNELRLLNNIFYDFLVTATLKKEIKDDEAFYNTWLAKGLADRGVKTVLSEDIDGLITSAKAQDKPLHIANLCERKFLNEIQRDQATAQSHASLMALIADAKKEVIRNLRYELRAWESREAMALFKYKTFTEKIDEKKSGDFRTEAATLIDISPLGEKDPVERFFILQKWAYQTKGALRIDVLKETLAILRQRKTKTRRDMLSHLAILGNLGLECNNLQRYTEAEECFAEGIELLQKHKEPMFAPLVHNYMGIQIMLEQYQKGIDIFKMFEEEIRAGQHSHRFILLLSYFYLMQRKPDAGIESVADLSNMDDELNIFRRMVYLIAFYLRGQTELAQNECENINRLLKARKGEWVEHYMWMNGLLRMFLTSQVQNKEQSKKEIRLLNERLVADAQRINEANITAVPVIWLLKELKDMARLVAR